MQIELTVLVAVIGCCVSAATFLIGRVSAANTKGTADGELKSDVKYIKSSIEKQDAKLSTIVGNYDAVKIEIEQLKGRLKALEDKVNYMHPTGGQ